MVGGGYGVYGARVVLLFVVHDCLVDVRADVASLFF